MFRKLKKILYRSMESEEISYEKLQEILKKDSNVVLLDVRSKQEFEINIPLYELEKDFEKIQDKTVTIIIYCATGYRSKQAKEKLKSKGYEKVYNLKNGLDGI